jgi:hypothetical protein
MVKIFNRRNILLALAAFVVLPVSWWISAPLRGRLMAHYDLAHGHYRVLAYGLPPAGADEYKHLLEKRYGVEYRQVALCIVSPSLISYVDAYDRVSAAAITRKFGHDVLREGWEEAHKEWQDKHKAELENVSRSE